MSKHSILAAVSLLTLAAGCETAAPESSTLAAQEQSELSNSDPLVGKWCRVGGGAECITIDASGNGYVSQANIHSCFRPGDLIYSDLSLLNTPAPPRLYVGTHLGAGSGLCFPDIDRLFAITLSTNNQSFLRHAVLDTVTFHRTP